MPSLYEYYNTGDDYTSTAIHSIFWWAQTFTVGAEPHTVTSVKLKLLRAGNPGTITVSIRASDGSGHPTGGDLTSGTTDGNTLPTGSPYEWREISLTEYALQANTKYAIVVRALNGNSSNSLKWRADSSAPAYIDGCCETSSDSGSSWTSYTGLDMMFEVWGNATGGPTMVYVTDSITLTDSKLVDKTLLLVADAIGLTDSQLVNKNITITDLISLLDGVLRNKSITIEDGIGLSDALLRHKTLTITDTITLDDVAELVTGIVKYVTDSIGLTDQTLVNKNLIVQDVIAALDEVFRHRPQILVSDAITLTEVLTLGKLCNIVDSISVSDTVLTNKNLNVTDTIGLTDSDLVNKSLVITDAVSLLDAILRHKTVTITDAVTLADALLTDKQLQVLDAVSLAEALSLNKTILIADSVSLSEQVLRNKTVEINDVIGLLDTAVLVTAWPSAVLVLNLKTRKLQIIIRERGQELQVGKRKMELKFNE